MTGRYLRMVFVTLTLLALAGQTQAARRSSLSGNLLIPDQDDIFFFPQLVTKYNRTVNFDFGTNEGLGQAGLIFGNESVTLGLYTHNSTFLGAIPDAYFTRGDIDNIVRDAAIPLGAGPDALNWIDIIAGFGWGDTPMGVRFSLGRNNIDPPSPTDEQSSTAVNVIVGASLEQWDTDVSGEFSYGDAREVVGMTTTETSPVQFGVGFRRHAADSADEFSLGWLGMFSYTDADVDVTGLGTQDGRAINLQVGVGPTYRPNDRTTIAAYGTFEYQQARTSQPLMGGTETDTASQISIPGWNIAGEFDLTSWLQFRAGARSRFMFNELHHEESVPMVPPVDERTKTNALDFAWTTGIGVNVGGFQFDGFIDPEVMTSGTDLLGESASGDLFGMVSGTYRF
jgi:hypothetical protein